MNKSLPSKPARALPIIAWSSNVNKRLVMLEKRDQLLKQLDVASNVTELKALLRKLIIITTE